MNAVQHVGHGVMVRQRTFPSSCRERSVSNIDVDIGVHVSDRRGRIDLEELDVRSHVLGSQLVGREDPPLAQYRTDSKRRPPRPPNLRSLVRHSCKLSSTATRRL